MYDAIIVGGGPAGLSAALILGRCLRRVLVIDGGRPRNAYAHAMHGYLGEHSISPTDFLHKAKAQLAHFETIHFLKAEVTEVKKTTDGFHVRLDSGEMFSARKLLLATGVVDELPPLDGILDLFGQSVFQCPYCDAWEVRGQPLAAYGIGDRGFNLAMMLTTWSSDVVLFTGGSNCLRTEQLEELARFEIPVCDLPIARLEGRDGILQSVRLADGSQIARRSLFFNTPSFIRSKLLDQLGCPYSEKEGVETGRYETTKVPGLFVAGNITRDVQLVIVAAAEGAQAAFGINSELAREDLSLRRSSTGAHKSGFAEETMKTGLMTGP